MEKHRVLFVCTHNSARSQMAEAMLRAFAGDSFEAFSAGTEAAGIRPEAIQVMSELGIDISAQRSKTIEPHAAVHPRGSTHGAACAPTDGASLDFTSR
jgi:arsenate reductase